MSLQIITLSCKKMDSIDQLNTNITSLIYGVIVLKNGGKGYSLSMFVALVWSMFVALVLFRRLIQVATVSV